MLGIILEESDYLEVRIPKRLFDGWPLLQHSDYLLHPESLLLHQQNPASDSTED
jgi:hypothetical protein